MLPLHRWQRISWRYLVLSIFTCVVLLLIVCKSPGLHDDGFTFMRMSSIVVQGGPKEECQPPPLTSSSVIDDCRPCLQPNRKRSPSEGRWYNYSTLSPTFLIYAYSAFYDDRPKNPTVQIIAMTTQFDKLPPGTSLYCRLQYADGRLIQVTAMSPPPSPIGMGMWMHGFYVREYIYSCRLPPFVEIPVAVVIGADVSAASRGIRTTPPPFIIQDTAGDQRCFMPIEIPVRLSPRRGLAVCVQVAYGDLDPVRLVEWLELQRLLGVELIGVYASPTVGRRAMDVFRKYSIADDGLVELRFADYVGPISPKSEFNVTTSNQYLLQGSPVINDCVYRHMYSFQFIGVYDFDEVILPRNYTKTTELLASVIDRRSRGQQEKSSVISEFTFSNNYFFLDLTPDTSISTNFTILRYNRKVAVSQSGYAAKSIIVASSCKAMHNHFCWEKIGNKTFQGTQRSIFVDENDALLHHYKRCHFSPQECQQKMRDVTVDETALKYKAALMSNVQNKLVNLDP